MQNADRKKGFEDKLVKMRACLAAGQPIDPADKIKVAVLADSPTVVTGFGNVCREVLDNLYKTGFYDFDIVGINYDGSPHNLPYRIYPAVNALIPDPSYRDPYGRQKFLDILGEGRFDLVWVLQDSFIVCEDLASKIRMTNEELPADKKFQFIFYFPIDATPKKHWLDDGVMHADFPVTYTQYAYDECMKVYSVGADTKLKPEEQEENAKQLTQLRNRLVVVSHGVNTKDFYPIEDEKIPALKQKYWDMHKEKFVFINVNRNQPRKDLFRTMQAFKILLDRRRAKGKDDVYLYLHCAVVDNNLNLIDMADQLNLTQGNEYGFPNPRQFSTGGGFPIHILNEIYNAADCVITTTLGEGWGLSLTEGMAVKRPIIAPDHTSVSEILGKTDAGTAERGFLVSTTHGFVQPNDNSRIRPITDPEAMADAMEVVVENRERIQPIVDRAYEWVSALTWDSKDISEKWQAIFETAYGSTLITRAKAIDGDIVKAMQSAKFGRNELCPVCNIKVKQCRHGLSM